MRTWPEIPPADSVPVHGADHISSNEYSDGQVDGQEFDEDILLVVDGDVNIEDNEYHYFFVVVDGDDDVDDYEYSDDFDSFDDDVINGESRDDEGVVKNFIFNFCDVSFEVIEPTGVNPQVPATVRVQVMILLLAKTVEASSAFVESQEA